MNCHWWGIPPTVIPRSFLLHYCNPSFPLPDALPFLTPLSVQLCLSVCYLRSTFHYFVLSLYLRRLCVSVRKWKYDCVGNVRQVNVRCAHQGGWGDWIIQHHFTKITDPANNYHLKIKGRHCPQCCWNCFVHCFLWVIKGMYPSSRFDDKNILRHETNAPVSMFEDRNFFLLNSSLFYFFYFIPFISHSGNDST